ncbi:MAG: DNA methyltransferase, partial [Actinomycetota bacterium]
MSRLNDLIRQVGEKDAALGLDLQREVTATLKDRLTFGLNFERHVPEIVELPGRRVRRGDKVRLLPQRGQMPKKADDKVWLVRDIEAKGDTKTAHIVAQANETEMASAGIEDLVVVAEFRDPIYPGLVSTGKVERGGDKPHHVVINAENYHALQLLLFTHRGKVDCIYIDPPYNTGARDWKYNNDYVESEDHYRHSQWLAFMERRLILCRDLLNPEASALIITIDEREYLRRGMLIHQMFPEASIQMVSSVINRKGVVRANELTRTNEFIFLLLFGEQ